MADQVFLSLLLVALFAAGAAAAAIESSKWIRARIRRYRVQKEMRRADLRLVPPPVSLADRRRPARLVSDVPALPSTDGPGNPNAARVATFIEDLERRGCYVHELSIQRRLN